MIGMHDSRHRSAAGGQAAERPGFRGVRVRHVEPAPVKQDRQRAQRSQVAARIDGSAQGRLDDHLQARRGRLIQQMVPAAGDDRDLELIRVKRLRAAQREHARPALQPGDEGGHPQRPNVHQSAQPAEAMESSRDQ